MRGFVVLGLPDLLRELVVPRSTKSLGAPQRDLDEPPLQLISMQIFTVHYYPQSQNDGTFFVRTMLGLSLVGFHTAVHGPESELSRSNRERCANTSPGMWQFLSSLYPSPLPFSRAEVEDACMEIRSNPRRLAGPRNLRRDWARNQPVNGDGDVASIEVFPLTTQLLSTIGMRLQEPESHIQALVSSLDLPTLPASKAFSYCFPESSRAMMEKAVEAGPAVGPFD